MVRYYWSLVYVVICIYCSEPITKEDAVSNDSLTYPQCAGCKDLPGIHKYGKLLLVTFQLFIDCSSLILKYPDWSAFSLCLYRIVPRTNPLGLRPVIMIAVACHFSKSCSSTISFLKWWNRSAEARRYARLIRNDTSLFFFRGGGGWEGVYI